MHRRFSERRQKNLKPREPYTVEECRKQVFFALISFDKDPSIPIVCNLMLDNMEDKNPNCELYGTALNRVARDDNLPMFKLIYEKIENKNPKNPNNESTPLHIAAENGCSKITRFILENSKADDINLPNTFDQTPLHLAEEYDHKEICKLLRSAISIQNNVPRNPRKKRKIT